MINEFQNNQDPVIRPLVERDTKTLQKLLSEIPLWVKNPDYDRVCIVTYLHFTAFSPTSLLRNLILFSPKFKVDWINKFLEYMWPYLDKVIASI